MKKTLLATSALAGVLVAGAAHAADLAPVYKAPPPVVAPVVNWTGFYIGAHVGGGWGTSEWSAPSLGSELPIGVGGPNYNVNGFLGGGQVGFNWQTGWVVFGVEADASAADIKGSGACLVFLTCSTKIDALGTITGRIGGTVDHALLYVKGGGAWAHEKNSISEDVFSTISSSKTRWGWTVGGGVEYAFTPNWSGKLEYNFIDLGKERLNFVGDSLDVRQTIHTVKVGLNYRFNWGAPIAARY